MNEYQDLIIKISDDCIYNYSEKFSSKENEFNINSNNIIFTYYLPFKGIN